MCTLLETQIPDTKLCPPVSIAQSLAFLRVLFPKCFQDFKVCRCSFSGQGSLETLFAFIKGWPSWLCLEWSFTSLENFWPAVLPTASVSKAACVKLIFLKLKNPNDGWIQNGGTNIVHTDLLGSNTSPWQITSSSHHLITAYFCWLFQLWALSGIDVCCIFHTWHF